MGDRSFSELLAAAIVHPLVGVGIASIDGDVGTCVEVDGGQVLVAWPVLGLPSGWTSTRWSTVELEDEGLTWERT